MGLYLTHCTGCHQDTGEGFGVRYPPIAQSDWVNGPAAPLIGVMLSGLKGEITVNGSPYNEVMPSFSFLSDAEVASVITFVRGNFGNKAGKVTAEEVAKVRSGMTEK
jgi:mono/diheme cytochrome c family protein